MRFLAIFALFLVGCRPIPPYAPPDYCLPKLWKGEEMASSSTSSLENWWEIFNDPALNELEALALQNSPTLNAAIWKYQEALALAKASRSPLFPEVTFIPNASNQTQLSTSFFNDANFQERFNLTQYSVPFLTTYEFDLFNKYRYGSEAAFATAEAKAEAFFAVQLALTAAVAKTYYQLRTRDAEEKVLEETIRLREQAYKINLSRFEAGLLNYSDVSKAETEFFVAKADLAEVVLMRARAENLLAILVGEYPSCFQRSRDPLEGDPPQIALTFPSEVIQSRPDIAEAERELASAYANLGGTVASLFPSMALSTQIGLSSSSMADLLSWKARFFSLAWNGLQTVFDAGKKQDEVASAKAQVYQLVNHYTETVLLAFQEVEDALAAIRWQRQALLAYEHAIASTEVSLAISEERFDKGLIIYLEVVDAERMLLSTKLAALRMQGQRFVSTIDLIKAMGGRVN